MNLRGLRRTSRTVNVVLLVAAVSLSPLAWAMHTANALPLAPLDEDVSEQDDQPTAQDDTAIRAPLQPGTPAPTTPEAINHTRTKLTWTPTGINETEDTYQVLITNTPGSEAGTLTGAPVLPVDTLSSNELDVNSLNEATYYWQVRSCIAQDACNPWSPVQTVTLDATAPAMATSEVTSGMYDQDVVITGATEPSNVVTLHTAESSCETTADGNGTWSCTFERLGFGTYEASVISRDVAGNESPAFGLPFSVNELFVATKIIRDDLPPVLEIVPADESPQSKVLQQPPHTIDSVNVSGTGEQSDVLGIANTLSSDGGIIQSSQNGWQVLGMPWFVWLGSLGGMFAGWWALGWPVPRRVGSMLSL